MVVGILLMGQHLYKVAENMSEPSATLLLVIYYIIPHLEFYDVRNLVIHNWGLIPWWVVGAATAYAAAYAALFLTAAWLVFRRKSLN